jgi:beta-lactam-binding protein with PASTA domain
MKQWLSFILSKQFLKHTALIGIAFIAFILLLFYWFRIYTQHNKSLTLNDLNELTLEQAEELLASKGLNYVIVDSSSFNPEYLPLAVIQQNPAPESKVKNGRTIYLWLNAEAPPYKSIPCLMGNATLNEAFDRLAQVGFEIGEITYKAMEELKDGNPILKMLIANKEVKCGDKGQWGQKIDLIVGEKVGANKVEIPNLLGNTLQEAEFLMNADLNFGTIIYEMEGLIDSSSMVIYKQLPDFGNEAIRIGSIIDVWLIQDLPADVSKRLEEIKSDTMNQGVN